MEVTFHTPCLCHRLLDASAWKDYDNNIKLLRNLELERIMKTTHYFHPGMRKAMDRRTGEDRRNAYNLDYFLNGGEERRRYVERRLLSKEKRSGWSRVSQWSSAVVTN